MKKIHTETLTSLIGELQHQDRVHEDNRHSPSEWLDIIEEIIVKARSLVHHNDDACLHEIRQLTACGFTCLEQHGSPARGESHTMASSNRIR